MKRIMVIVVIFVLATVVLSSCGQAETNSPDESQRSRSEADSNSYANIPVVQLKSMLENKDFLLINVHIPYAGEIPGTDLFIPYNEMQTNLFQLPEDRGAKIVLYCAMGPMSETAAKTLTELGYTNISTVDGGMMAWKGQNYELDMMPR